MPAGSPIKPLDRRLGQSPESLEEILDDLISFAEAAKIIPPNRDGKRAHVATIYRWHNPGVAARAPGRKGERIPLQAVCRPAGWMTTRRWLAEFFEAITADRAGQPAASPSHPSTARRRHQEHVEKALDAIGI